MRSLRYKLILLILPLCLVPLIGISVFSYIVSKERITEDRIVLYLEQIAEEVADAIHLTLLEKKEELVSMALHAEFRDFMQGNETAEEAGFMLDKLLLVHQVYDLLVLFDAEGNLLLTNTIDRNSGIEAIELLDPAKMQELRGKSLEQFTPGSQWLRRVRSRRFGFINWHKSPLTEFLYPYEEADIARQYAIGFAAPIMDERNVVIGGILALMNWSYIQEILDKVEEDFEQRSLTSGYAFLFGNNRNTIIGHKYRLNREFGFLEAGDIAQVGDYYGSKLVEDLGLEGLHQAVVDGRLFYEYEFPPETPKISGLAPIDHEFFQWVCGVGVNNEDIFEPVFELRTILIWVASLSTILVVMLTYAVARRITVPLKKLTEGASEIAGGNFGQRVAVAGSDEIGELARTFNEMAASLEERSEALIELNRRLEEKVRERTRELEETNQEVQKAYETLKDTQFQLIQSEKMASLGQLVAGIAHEIKNPLNFIYGNTDFLRRYVGRLNELVEQCEEELVGNPEASRRVSDLKDQMNYTFLQDDLKTLIDNFEEGARRIHDIIGDLRTFSRLDSEEFKKVDIHEPIELALSLLQNEYRGRITIHRQFGELPLIECHSGRINQVLMNLIANACQAIPEEGEITIRTRNGKDRAFIEVEDTGVGISPDDLDRIFEPFFTTKPVGKGTGLGLSISYAIIQRHNGTIDVRSKVGGGTLFRISLPIDQ